MAVEAHDEFACVAIDSVDITDVAVVDVLVVVILDLHDLVTADDRKIERFGWTFAPGDKVMQIENDYDKDVYNGDVGYIDAVDSDAGELIVSFDGHSVTYGFGELDALVPAYAASIHKSQGSEYPAVVIPVMTQSYPMLQRNLLYTGVTR